MWTQENVPAPLKWEQDIVVAQLPIILGSILNQALCRPFPQGTLLPQTPCSLI